MASSASAERVKYRWYETDPRVVVEVPLKNVNEQDVTVNYAPQNLEISIKLPDDEIYSLKLNLFKEIVPNECSYRIRSSKVEVYLPKVQHSRWDKLEKDEPKPEVSVQTKNWDKVVKENLTENDEDSSIDQLFAKIYADGNDDQKRAMLKSFTESGGTVLSTNWDEVGKKKVDIKPPEGLEFKSWN